MTSTVHSTAFVDAVMDAVCRQQFFKVFQSPCGDIHHRSLLGLNTELSKGRISQTFTCFWPFPLCTELFSDILKLDDGETPKFLQSLDEALLFLLILYAKFVDTHFIYAHTHLCTVITQLLHSTTLIQATNAHPH